MAWVRLDDHFFEHPKIVGLSDAAFRLQVGALCYAARHTTNGHIGASAVRLVGGTPRSISALVAARLWEPANDGWQLHDYLEYNLTAGELADRRGRRVEAGRLGGLRSGAARRDRHGQDSSPDPDEASASPSASREDSASTNPDPDPDPDPGLVPDPNPILIPGPIPAAAAAAAEPLPLLVRHWERSTGTTVTPALADWLDSELGEGTPPDWLRDAISETGVNGIKAWKYTQRIIQRWRVQGREPAEGGRDGRGSRSRDTGRSHEKPCRVTGQYHDWPNLPGWCERCTEQEPITLESLRRKGLVIE